MKNKKLLVVVQTVIIIALLIAAELLSKVIPSVKFFGITLNIFIADTLFNFILIFAAAVFGLSCSAAAAVVSPIICALISLTQTKIPAMIIVFITGNLALVFIVWVCCRASKGLGRTSSKLLTLIGFLLGAVMKMTTMWAVTEKFVITYLKTSKEVSEKLLSLLSTPQLEAAIFGALLSFFLIPILKSAFKSR